MLFLWVELLEGMGSPGILWGAHNEFLLYRMLGSMGNSCCLAQDDWKSVGLHVETLYLSWNSCEIVEKEISLFGYLSSPLLGKFYLIECSGCLNVCRKWLDSICMFSMLKTCKYSLYSDTIKNLF